MRTSLTKLLCDPETGEPLELVRFDDSELDEVRAGALVRERGDRAYAIVDGVPLLRGLGCSAEFLRRHAAQLAAYPNLRPAPGAEDEADWSFSDEWAHHQERELERTWGWTVDERVEQFLLELELERQDIAGQLVLDAGCGNGMLSAALTRLDVEVVAPDYSTSVFRAEARRGSARVHYLQADLSRPPLAPASFDLVVSNGVLHHTPDTRAAFDQVARLVKPGGRFYLWLYRLPEGFARRYLVYGGIEAARKLISRLGPAGQRQAVHAYARAQQLANRVRGKHRDVGFDDLIIGAYDSLTPRWRHFHEPTEVSRWFHEAGFGPGRLTHWDNPWGFGMVAVKREQPLERTPGVHYGDAGS